MTKQAKRLARPAGLVAGGIGPIGHGIAVALARSGFDVAIVDRPKVAHASEALQAIQQCGVSAWYCRGDVSVAADRQTIIDAVRHRFGRLDVLVNCPHDAAAAGADILDATEASVDRLIGTNIKGPYFLTQVIARWMVEQHREDATFAGVIINVAPANSVEAPAARGGYCISRAGIAMATQLWAVRLAEFGIAVYEVRPGVMATESAMVTEEPDKLLADELTVDNRGGRPEDVGRAVAMLARDELPYATGNVLKVDGGLTLRRL